MTKPAGSDGSRRGASPTTQFTAATRPQIRHTRWRCLSPVRVSYRTDEPAGSIRRTKPALTHARNTSQTPSMETEPHRLIHAVCDVSAVECGLAARAFRTAALGAVTRNPAARSRAWGSRSRAKVTHLACAHSGTAQEKMSEEVKAAPAPSSLAHPATAAARVAGTPAHPGASGRRVPSAPMAQSSADGCDGTWPHQAG